MNDADTHPEKSLLSFCAYLALDLTLDRDTEQFSRRGRERRRAVTPSMTTNGMAADHIFAYPPGEVRIGRSDMTEQPHGAWGGASFESTYAENVHLLGFIVKVRFRVPEGDAESLVHDVFLKYARDYENVRNARHWLTAAASNASLNYWRDRAREVPLPPDMDRWEDPTAAGEADAILTRLAVGRALHQLGERCRDVLHRFHVDGESTQAIANSLGTTAGYIQLRLHLCRKRARAIYTTLTRIRS